MVVSVMSASSRTEITQKSWDKFSTTLHIVQSFNQNPERIVSSQTQNTTCQTIKKRTTAEMEFYQYLRSKPNTRQGSA